MRSRALRWLGAGLLVGVSTALTLGVVEVGLRLAGYQAIYSVYSKPSLFWEHDDLLGWSHTPGASGRYVGPRPWPIEFDAPVEINSLGLRGPDVPPRAPGELRILLLGDSVVVGFEVPWEQTFGALLERRVAARLARPVRVVNAAVRGYGTDQSYLYFRERGARLEPDVVVFVHSNNDAEDNRTLHRMRRPFGKAAFTPQEDGSLALRGHPVPRYPLCSSWVLDDRFEPVRRDGRASRLVCQIQLGFADHSALFSFLALRIRQNPDLLVRLYSLGAPPGERRPAAPDPGYRLTNRLIAELGLAARAHGAAFVALLTEGQAHLLDPEGLAQRGVRSEILLDGVLPGVDPRSIRFQRDSHFDPRGHELMAEFLEPLVLELAQGAGRR
jgi:lysophospholipase L1-like esterase